LLLRSLKKTKLLFWKNLWRGGAVLWVDVGSKSAKIGLVYWIRGEENNRFQGRDVLVFVTGRTAVDVGRRIDVLVVGEKRRVRDHGTKDVLVFVIVKGKLPRFENYQNVKMNSKNSARVKVRGTNGFRPGFLSGRLRSLQHRSFSGGRLLASS
jgi:hypothetical protein